MVVSGPDPGRPDGIVAGWWLFHAQLMATGMTAMNRTDIASTADRIRIEEQMMNGFAMTRLGNEGAILAPRARISTADAVVLGVDRAESTQQVGGFRPVWRAQLVCGVLVVLLHLLMAFSGDRE